MVVWVKKITFSTSEQLIVAFIAVREDCFQSAPFLTTKHKEPISRMRLS